MTSQGEHLQPRWPKREPSDRVARCCWMIVAALLAGAILLQLGPASRSEGPAPTNLYAAAAETDLSSSRLAQRNIEDIRAGDLVLAHDTETGITRAKRVVRAFRRTAYGLRVLRVRAAGDDAVQELKTTDEHPFWVVGQGWVNAGDLKIGQQVLQADGDPATVVSTEAESHPEGVPVYNFETADYHTYFVSAHGTRAPPVLVHNVGDCAGLGDSKSARVGGASASGEPRGTLPRTANGDYLPDPNATGPHTTLGTRVRPQGPEPPYTQGATFDRNGNFLGRTDVTNHARPDHVSPHFHPATSPSSVGPVQPIE